MNLITYELSEEADSDLDSIFDYTEREHGYDQAVKYLLELAHLFEQLVLNPNLGRQRGELKSGILSIAAEQHLVFYTFNDGLILIVRVLHGRMDVPKYLDL